MCEMFQSIQICLCEIKSLGINKPSISYLSLQAASYSFSVCILLVPELQIMEKCSQSSSKAGQKLILHQRRSSLRYKGCSVLWVMKLIFGWLDGTEGWNMCSELPVSKHTVIPLQELILFLVKDWNVCLQVLQFCPVIIFHWCFILISFVCHQC
jgi:hypothetical protein